MKCKMQRKKTKNRNKIVSLKLSKIKYIKIKKENTSQKNRRRRYQQMNEKLKGNQEKIQIAEREH